MATFPEKYLDLLSPEKKALAILATVQPDGTPQATPVWFDVDGDKVRVNTASNRVKARNMKVGAGVALAILDPANPYRYLQIRGKVVSSTEEGADAHTDALTKKYLGLDSYPYRNPAETRVIFTIEPTSFQAMGS
jgi:PPOX class probable F420-dependent enzyme